MSLFKHESRESRRRLFWVALYSVVLFMVVYLAPTIAELIWYSVILQIPPAHRDLFRVVCAVLLCSLILRLGNHRPEQVGPFAISDRFWNGVDLVTSWGLRIGMPLVLAAFLFAMVLAWLPHYLTWPWWTDTDYFALSAHSWDRGILPYRDLHDFNFPGPTYVHWILGKCFGWDQMVAFNAFDAILLLVLGVSLLGWSQVKFGQRLPGLIGFVGVIHYYTGLDYSQVGQRDWHAPLLTVLALLLLQARPGRTGQVISGLLYAFALTIRPHPIVLLPAMLSALDESARDPGESLVKTVRACLVWGGSVAVGLLLGAAPILLAQVADDFLYWFRLASVEGGYNRSTSRGFMYEVIDQFLSLRRLVLMVALGGLSIWGGARHRTARTWFLALVFVVCYRPLSPIMHDYLRHPGALIWHVGLGVGLSWILLAERWTSLTRLLIVSFLLFQTWHKWPTYCSYDASRVALHALWRGEVASEPPPGVAMRLPLETIKRAYSWNDYQGVIAYLKKHTTEKTMLANMLRRQPFPSLQGATGRLSVFPSPGGILWLRFAAPDQELLFASALENAQDAVVVWAPVIEDEWTDLKLEHLETVVRRHYEPEARIGKIEVWRKRAREREPGPVRP